MSLGTSDGTSYAEIEYRSLNPAIRAHLSGSGDPTQEALRLRDDYVARAAEIERDVDSFRAAEQFAPFSGHLAVGDLKVRAYLDIARHLVAAPRPTNKYDD